MERVLFAHRVLPALRPDVAHDLDSYTEWMQGREEWRSRQFVPRSDAEVLNLVMVIAAEPTPETVQTLHALAQQTTAHWTLTVVVRNSWQTAFTALLGVSGLHRTSQRVRVESTDDSAAPAHMLSRGLAANAGAPVALLFPGDVWAPDAVAQLASSLSPLGVVYADEDCVTGAGAYEDPRLKPSYSPEFLLSSSYVGRPLAIGSGDRPPRRTLGRQPVRARTRSRPAGLRGGPPGRPSPRSPVPSARDGARRPRAPGSRGRTRGRRPAAPRRGGRGDRRAPP